MIHSTRVDGAVLELVAGEAHWRCTCHARDQFIKMREKHMPSKRWSEGCHKQSVIPACVWTRNRPTGETA